LAASTLTSTANANPRRSQPIEFRGRRRATIRPTAAKGSVMIPTPFNPAPGGILAESAKLHAASTTNRKTTTAVTGEMRRRPGRLTT
jgi:hypothetical protein